MRKTAAVILFLISFQTLYGDTTRILFTGNSYTEFNNLPELFKQLSSSDGKIVYTEMSAPGGYTFEGHTQLQATLDKISSRNWNYVVLQEQSQYPSIPYYRDNSTYPSARKLDSLIKLRGSSTVLYMTWGRKYGGIQCINGYCSTSFRDFFHMQDSLSAAYNMIAGQLNALLAPVGLAWKRARLLDSTIELFNPDNSHPSLEGSYLAACVFYSKIYGASPVGLSYNAGLPQNTALWLQQVAADIILPVNANYNNLPAMFNLNQNYPNPFNPSTTIRFTLSIPGNAVIKLFNAAGREIGLLADSYYPAGSHYIRFDAADLPSGVYFCSLSSGPITLSRKMLLIK